MLVAVVDIIFSIYIELMITLQFQNMVQSNTLYASYAIQLLVAHINKRHSMMHTQNKGATYHQCSSAMAALEAGLMVGHPISRQQIHDIHNLLTCIALLKSPGEGHLDQSSEEKKTQKTWKNIGRKLAITIKIQHSFPSTFFKSNAYRNHTNPSSKTCQFIKAEQRREGSFGGHLNWLDWTI